MKMILDDVRADVDDILNECELNEDQAIELMKVQVLVDIASTLRFIKSSLDGGRH